MDGAPPPPPPPPPPPMPWHAGPGVMMLPGAVVAGLALGAGVTHLVRLRHHHQQRREEEAELERRRRRYV